MVEVQLTGENDVEGIDHEILCSHGQMSDERNVWNESKLGRNSRCSEQREHSMQCEVIILCGSLRLCG
jgi:hypothetical protein